MSGRSGLEPFEPPAATQRAADLLIRGALNELHSGIDPIAALSAALAVLLIEPGQQSPDDLEELLELAENYAEETGGQP